MKINVVTHNGKFHPDEIFASVLLDWYFLTDKLNFIRTRNEISLKRYKESKHHYVIDVGDVYDPNNLNFDHHQSTFTDTGKNGDLMSSCGIMWKYLNDKDRLGGKPTLKELYNMSDFMINKIDAFVIKVDRHDNGVEYFPELDFISMCNFAHGKQDANFKYAFKLASEYFLQLFNKWRYEEEQELADEKALSQAQGGIIYAENKLSVSKKLNSSNNLLLVTERAENEYSIMSLNHGQEVDFTVRCPAPYDWAGLSGAEIEKIDPRLVFSHKNRFITIVKGTKDDAMEIARFIILNHVNVMNLQYKEHCDCGL